MGKEKSGRLIRASLRHPVDFETLQTTHSESRSSCPCWPALIPFRGPRPQTLDLRPLTAERVGCSQPTATCFPREWPSPGPGCLPRNAWEGPIRAVPGPQWTDRRVCKALASEGTAVLREHLRAPCGLRQRPDLQLTTVSFPSSALACFPHFSWVSLRALPPLWLTEASPRHALLLRDPSSAHVCGAI